MYFYQRVIINSYRLANLPGNREVIARCVSGIRKNLDIRYLSFCWRESNKQFGRGLVRHYKEGKRNVYSYSPSLSFPGCSVKCSVLLHT